VIAVSVVLVNRHRVVNRAKRQLEIERVRNNIARDLHDDIGSTMSSINIVSQMALAQRNGSAEGHFRKIADQSSALMERMSDIVWSIHPANDSLQMIASRIKEFTAEILDPKNIRYSFVGLDSFNGEILDVEKRKNLFLICKEAINNAAKYSDASEVQVTLSQAGKNLILDVSDNGKGFDVELSKRGNGLSNIAARAKSMNAALEIRSQPTRGTTIRLVIQLT
jgi:signal transduction histidine kinase